MLKESGDEPSDWAKKVGYLQPSGITDGTTKILYNKKKLLLCYKECLRNRSFYGIWKPL